MISWYKRLKVAKADVLRNDIDQRIGVMRRNLNDILQSFHFRREPSSLDKYSWMIK